MENMTLTFPMSWNKNAGQLIFQKLEFIGKYASLAYKYLPSLLKALIK